MKFWARTFKDNRMTRDTVIENNENDTRTHKVFKAIESVCIQFDISRPIWLDLNISDFQKYSKVRFTRDSFIDDIPFDYLEFLVIEED